MNQIDQTLNLLARAGRVRLDTEEIGALAYALDRLAPQRVALFGSRVEPDRRGGDVDLLILSDAPAYETDSHQNAVPPALRSEEVP